MNICRGSGSLYMFWHSLDNLSSGLPIRMDLSHLLENLRARPIWACQIVPATQENILIPRIFFRYHLRY